MKEGGGEWMGYVKGSKVVVDLCNTTHENGQTQRTTPSPVVSTLESHQT